MPEIDPFDDTLKLWHKLTSARRLALDGGFA
jgi:hypothetical protein